LNQCTNAGIKRLAFGVSAIKMHRLRVRGRHLNTGET